MCLLLVKNRKGFALRSGKGDSMLSVVISCNAAVNAQNGIYGVIAYPSLKEIVNSTPKTVNSMLSKMGFDNSAPAVYIFNKCRCRKALPNY